MKNYLWIKLFNFIFDWLGREENKNGDLFCYQFFNFDWFKEREEDRGWTE